MLSIVCNGLFVLIIISKAATVLVKGGVKRLISTYGWLFSKICL